MEFQLIFVKLLNIIIKIIIKNFTTFLGVSNKVKIKLDDFITFFTIKILQVKMLLLNLDYAQSG